MWVGKNNLCAGGMLSATIEYNGLCVGACFNSAYTLLVLVILFTLNKHLNIEANPYTAKEYHFKIIHPIVRNGVFGFGLKFIPKKSKK